MAGGSGRRFGSLKQFESVAGRRVLDWSIGAASSVGRVVAVVPAGPAVDELTEPGAAFGAVRGEVPDAVRGATATVAGGPTRSGSVRCGLAAVPADAEVVLVHDGARPLADVGLFCRVVDAVRSGSAVVVPAVPVTDTLRDRSDGAVVDRDRLVAVQTPQGFDAGVLRRAHAGGGEATDDAALAQEAGCQVTFVAGDPHNLKITTQDDLVMASALLERRLAMAQDRPGATGPEQS